MPERLNLSELKRVESKATKGPWYITARAKHFSVRHHTPSSSLPLATVASTPKNKENAEFIRLSRQAVPTLVDALEVAMKKLDDIAHMSQIVLETIAQDQAHEALAHINTLIDFTEETTQTKDGGQ